MAKKLTNLKITKVSLVDEGACSAAHITLFKQKKGGSEMTFEEMMESLSEEQQAIIKAKFDAQNEELEKAKEECSEKEQELEEAKKAFSEKEEELEKVKQEKKDLETKASETEEEEAEDDLAVEADSEDGVTKAKKELTEEEILKNVDPAVREMIQKAKSEAEVHKQAVLKMKEEKEIAEVTEIAKSLSGVGTEETQMVSMLRKAKSLDVELYAEVLKALQVANNIIADSELLKEKGQSFAGNDVDAWSKVDAKADEIAKTRGVSKAKATNIVIDEFPELYQAYLDSLR
ncbi:MAG TPA: hypothetical protein IAC02_04095 [Candidatus Coprovivens excrementavium]|nr:hypothetical protein [Candidatus Coprovivens excrementavium]